MSKVSIIVPVHNTEKYLAKCLDSILRQTLEDIEVILVENGSTDGSLALCYSLAETDTRIKVLHLDKGDLSTARNIGVQQANSPYIGFIDSDDTILPTMYEEMYRLAVNNDLGVVVCNFVCKQDDVPDKYLFPEDGHKIILSAKELTILNFKEKISKTACTMLYKKELFKAVQFPQNMFYEDRASTFLFMSKCGYGGVINKSFYCYYQRSNSICHEKSYINLRDYVLADCKRLDFLRKSGMFTASEQGKLAYKTGNVLIRHLRKLSHLAKTREQKIEYLSLLENIRLIPKGMRLAPNAFFSLLYIGLARIFQKV